ncbi:MAG: hypothetical protein WAN65_30935 [Candidatus Sulfotelmatobacter sp.]
MGFADKGGIVEAGRSAALRLQQLRGGWLDSTRGENARAQSMSTVCVAPYY